MPGTTNLAKIYDLPGLWRSYILRKNLTLLLHQMDIVANKFRNIYLYTHELMQLSAKMLPFAVDSS